jgi:hypothetical protein
VYARSGADALGVIVETAREVILRICSETFWTVLW